jgi:hypothetical protein
MRFTEELTATLRQVFDHANAVAQAARRTQTELGSLASFFVARCTQALASVELLSRSGLIGDAKSVMRTIVELEIDFAYIVGADTAERIRIFIGFERMSDWRHASAIEALPENSGGIDAAAMAILRERRDAVAGDYPAEFRGWSGRTVGERARATGRGHNYSLPYADACTASHSGPGTLRYAAIVRDEDLIPSLAPREADSVPVQLAGGVFLLLLADVIDACGLALQEPQQRVHDRFFANPIS